MVVQHPWTRGIELLTLPGTQLTTKSLYCWVHAMLNNAFAASSEPARILLTILFAITTLTACTGGDISSTNTNTTAPTPADPPVVPAPGASAYTLTVANSGGGIVTSLPAGITCGATCSASFTSGQGVTLSATASSGYSFTGWSGLCSGTSTCTTTMSATRTVTAEFALISTGGNAINLSLVAARSSGVAPLAVFFDASGTTANATTRPFHDLEFRWNFGDATAGTWNNGARPGVSSKNSATGPVAAHVFETPGTYTVSVTATDGTNVATTTTAITVQNPDTVFSGAKTICFSGSANYTDCPAGATQVNTSDFTAAVYDHIAPNSRLLFHRGEVFTAASSARIDKNGPGIIGAYGAGVAPVVRMTSNVSTLVISSNSTPTLKDWRVMDLDFDGMNAFNSNADVAGIDAAGGFNQLLVLRMIIRNIFRGISASHWQLSPGQNIYDEWAVVDSVVTPIVAGCNGCDWRVYITGKRTAILGNLLDNMDTGGSHVIRSEYTAKGVISDNTISKPGTGVGHAIKLHAWDWIGGAGGNATPSTYTEQVVISGNKIIGAHTPWTIALGPQDDSHDERVRDIIVERNWFTAGPSTQVHIYNNASDATIRNNILDMSGAAYHTFITVTRRGFEPAPSNVHVYNNTFYSGTTGDFEGVLIGQTVASISVINNLGSGPFASGQVMISGTSGLTQSNNRLYNMPSALFVSSAPVNPADFGLSPTSPARESGLSTIPVFSDFFRASRPLHGLIDVGAVEAP